MKERNGAFVAAAWMGARLLWPPPGHNTHTVMYPLVEAGGAYNTLEPFHALYLPVVTACRRLWEIAGAAPPALPAIQAVSLAAGAANIILLHRVVRKATGSSEAGLGAALILAVSANLWSWSLMTTSYTLATFCLLAAADRLVTREKLDARDAAWAGLWTGLAAGLDTAAGVAALAVAYELYRRRSTARAWAAFAGAAAAPVLLGLLLLFARLKATGWPFPPTLAGFIGSLPYDIIPLWKSRDVIGQIKIWAGSTAPLDLPLAAAAAIVYASHQGARTWSERALWRYGAGLWAWVSLFFFINDPHNRFLYASATIMPGLFLLATRSKRWAPAALAAALAAWHFVAPPAYAVEDNLGIAEARFLGGKLGREDVLAALSEPDWVFAYFYGARSRVIKLSRPGDAEVRFGAELAATPAELEQKLDEALCAGHKAVFAADALFRTSKRSPEALDAEGREVFTRLTKRYTVEPAWVSPRDQHYLPLRARSCPKPI